MNCIKVSVLQINVRLIPADNLLLYQLYQNFGELITACRGSLSLPVIPGSQGINLKLFGPIVVMILLIYVEYGSTDMKH